MAQNKWKKILGVFFEDGAGRLAFGVLLLLICVACLSFASPYDPDRFDLGNTMGKPSPLHWFGTDEYGRDYLTRALYGGRVSILIGVLSVFTSTVIGASVGVVSGYFGGILDELLMRVVDLFMLIPTFLIMVLIRVFFHITVNNIVFLIGGLIWMNTARLVRAETLSVKEREYVLYARVSGQSDGRILMRHVLPNIMPVIIVATVTKVGSAVLLESSLSYLGIGVPMPAATWGSMLNNAQIYFSQAPRMAIIPGALILLLVMSLNILGDRLQKALDHRNEGRYL